MCEGVEGCVCVDVSELHLVVISFRHVYLCFCMMLFDVMYLLYFCKIAVIQSLDCDGLF